MSTLVCFHAHPDDESIATGGTMAKAKADGHRVVLVVATRGERGEVADGFLEHGEQLADRRVRETHASAAVLGIDRVEFLGYEDSGMMGEPTNDHPPATKGYRVHAFVTPGYVAEMRKPSPHNPYYGLGIYLAGTYTDRRGYGNPEREPRERYEPDRCAEGQHEQPADAAAPDLARGLFAAGGSGERDDGIGVVVGFHRSAQL